MAIVAVLMCVNFTACEKEDGDPLIGSWYYLRIDGTCRWEYTYTFEPNGDFYFSGTPSAWSEGNDIWHMEYGTSSGKYTINGKVLTITYSEGCFEGDKDKYTIMSLNKSTLVLTSENGNVRTFTKLE